MHLHSPDLKKELRQLRDPRSPDNLGASVNCFAFNADDSRLVLGLGHRAVVWSPDDLEANPVPIAGHGKKVMGVGFLPGGQVLTAGMDGTARVWDQNTGEAVRSFDWGIGKVTTAAVSPDGTLCAVGSVNGQVLVWDIDS
ncbi:MAG: WD40 repeat domain-containing protein [Gemmataceae bacterium]